jgi:peptidyl-prolyl cis-trans isomerase D
MAMGKSKGSRAAVWVILLLLIVGLAGFGATNFGGNVRAIGQVGDTDISIDRYARALNDELAALSAQTGQQIRLTQAQAFGLDRAVLEQVVASTALEHEAARAGISVGDARVGEYLRAIPSFQGLDGSFDREAYQFSLERSGMTIAEFEEGLRAEVARTLLQSAAATGVTAPDIYSDTILNFIAETRDVAWVTLGPAALAEPVGPPSEADLTAYYEANPAAYTRPEARQITYAWVTPDMMLDRITPDEDALRSLYQERIDIYVQPERRLAERLVFGSEAEAAAAKARIDAGEATFDDIVAERGLALGDVDIGDVTEAELGAAGAAVFALDGPGIAGPVQSALGPALFRVNAILGAQETSFEEARAELDAEFAADRARREILGEIEVIDDLLAAGATLEELAEETPMELGTIDWTSASESGIAAYAAFREAAASVAEGDFPEVVELDDGGIFALRLDAVRAPELRPLAEVRDGAVADWIAAETTRRIAEEAARLGAEIEGGATFNQLELVPLGEVGLTREDFIADVPEGFVARVFEMTPGTTSVLEGDAQAVLIRLDAVNAPDLSSEALAERRSAIGDAVTQSLGQDVLGAFTGAVENAAGITLNQQAINAVHAQFP